MPTPLTLSLPDNLLPGNLMPDPFIESGSGGLWSPDGIQPTFTTIVSNDQANAHSGTSYININTGATAVGNVIMSSTTFIAVTPGQLVTLNGWTFRISGAHANCGWSVEVQNASNTGFEWHQDGNASAIGSWTFGQSSFVVPALGARLKFYCQLDGTSQTGAARFDDCYIRLDNYDTVAVALALPEVTMSGRWLIF